MPYGPANVHIVLAQFHVQMMCSAKHAGLRLVNLPAAVIVPLAALMLRHIHLLTVDAKGVNRRPCISMV